MRPQLSEVSKETGLGLREGFPEKTGANGGPSAPAGLAGLQAVEFFQVFVAAHYDQGVVLADFVVGRD